MQETGVRSLGQEDPLEKEMVTHSIILVGKSQGQRSLAGYNPWGCKESDTTVAKQQYITMSIKTKEANAIPKQQWECTTFLW